MLELTSKEQIRIEIIKQAINKSITQKEAANKLEISERQVRRIIANCKKNGDNAIIHQNKGKPSHNKKIPERINSEMVNTYLNEYSDYNFTHFYEEQGFKYGVSYSSTIGIFNEYEIISPLAQHKTIRLYNENMKKQFEITILRKIRKIYLNKEKRRV